MDNLLQQGIYLRTFCKSISQFNLKLQSVAFVCLFQTCHTTRTHHPDSQPASLCSYSLGGYGVLRHFQQYFSYIVALSFIGGGKPEYPEKNPRPVTDKLYHTMS